MTLPGDQYAALDKILTDNKWFGAEKAAVSMVILGDYETEEGKQLLLSTLKSEEKVS